MLAVFGPELKPEKQAQVALLLLLICIVGEIYGDPYQEETPRHKVLAQLELTSLFVEWWTMWSGLMIFQLDDSDPMGVVLTITVILANTALLVAFIVLFIRSKLYERKQDKLLADSKHVESKKPSFLSNRFASLKEKFGIRGSKSKEVEMTSCENPMQTKNAKRAIQKQKRKKRMRKVRKKLSLSKTTAHNSNMSKNANDSNNDDAATNNADDNQIFEDGFGRQYKWNAILETTEWIDVDNMNNQQEESVSGEMKWNENKTMLKSVENNDVEIDIYDGSSELDPELNLKTGEAKSSSRKRTEKSATQRTKRLSKVMKARRNSMQSVESKRLSFRKIEGNGDTDAYYQNVVTGDVVWEVPKDAVIEENAFQVNPMKRKSFKRIDDEETGRTYYQNVETGGTVWEVPEDGDVIESTEETKDIV